MRCAVSASGARLQVNPGRDRTVVHVTRPLTRPAATVGTAFPFGVVAVGVSPADVGADGRVAGRRRLRRTRPRPNVVDLVEKVTAFAARGHHLGPDLSVAYQRQVDSVSN